MDAWSLGSNGLLHADAFEEDCFSSLFSQCRQGRRNRADSGVHKTSMPAPCSEQRSTSPGVADDHGEPVVGADYNVVFELSVANIAGDSKPLALPAAIAIICQVQRPISALWAAALKPKAHSLSAMRISSTDG